MAIDIFAIQPSVISRNLKGKSFLIYGRKKSGKTSNAVKFERPILLGFEKGWNMLSGVIAQPVNKWTEALTIKKQLLKDAREVEKGNKKETHFQTVIVDTGDIAYDQCEAYILTKEGKQYLDETESKRGYKATEREFDTFFQEIVKAGYTLVVISHSETKQVKENGEKYDRTQPTMDKRGMKVVSRLVDVIGFADIMTRESGEDEMVLIMRGNKYLEAGSRNKHMSHKIPFTYQALEEDMAQAVEKLEKEGATVSDEAITAFKDQSKEVNFEEVRESIKQIAIKLNGLDKENETCLMNDYVKIVENHLGIGRTVRDCTHVQAGIMGMILQDLKEYAKENNIEL